MSGGLQLSPSGRSAVDTLADAVFQGDSFIALVGEPGIDRSAILDQLVAEMADTGVAILRLQDGATGSIGVNRLIRLIAGDAEAGNQDDPQPVLRVLADPAYVGQHLLFMVEQADQLSRGALALLKMLPTQHRALSPPAQILLVGRPGRWTSLTDPAPALPDAVAETPVVIDEAPERIVGRRWPVAPIIATLLVASTAMGAAVATYNFFYSSVRYNPGPFHQAPQAEQAAGVAAAGPAAPIQPEHPAMPNPPPVTPAPPEIRPDASQQLRRDFDAFLKGTGGRLAHLKDAERHALFEQYLARRADGQKP